MTALKSSLFILFIAALLHSCGNSQHVESNESWSLELNKGGCMDVCSAYQLKIDHSGRFHYTGIQNVKYIGEKSGEISDRLLTELNEILSDIDWSTFETTYGSPGTGIQRNELHFNANSTDKQIVYYRGEPQAIREIDEFIEQLIARDDL
jgi:hypothetical protein